MHKTPHVMSIVPRCFGLTSVCKQNSQGFSPMHYLPPRHALGVIENVLCKTGIRGTCQDSPEGRRKPRTSRQGRYLKEMEEKEKEKDMLDREQIHVAYREIHSYCIYFKKPSFKSLYHLLAMQVNGKNLQTTHDYYFFLLFFCES